MDSLPDLQWKNPDKGVCGYCDVQFSAFTALNAEKK